MDFCCFPKLVDPAETFLCCLPLGAGVKLLMWPHHALTLYTVATARLSGFGRILGNFTPTVRQP